MTDRVPFAPLADPDRDEGAPRPGALDATGGAP